MILSFFRALNPTSTKSGIGFPSYAVEQEEVGKEIVDETVFENVKSFGFSTIETPIRNVYGVFEILTGKHYSLGYLGTCSKGLLDFLVFPLISRVLVNEFEHSNYFIAALAWSIALPLEIARFSLAVGLTLLIAPIVAIAHLASMCLPNQEPDNAPSLA